MIRRFALLLALLLPLSAFAASPAPAPLVEGVDYDVLAQPGTLMPTKPGEVEIVEVFAYTCPHCAHFAPMVEEWKAKLPTNVVLRLTPPGYNPADPLERAYFASQEIGTLGLTHLQTFQAIHEAHDLPRNPTDSELTAYYTTLGVDAAKFQAALDGAKVMQRMQAAKQFSLRIELPGTPTMVVAGRWRVLGKSYEDMLRIAAALATNPPN
ncbi:thiol:disulfide interchange protein DsbA/DsbL [Lysobacter sp. KIS68-7]|uniref:thiol:disulfide interchange protein DsbA/DsbL n=1 Tax=Lysobacter sp. KIS68-7 TaxID=2904252 RepID=UPI001E4CBF78|nr:thiol:disulfide interchange protein DsbA/DsbL [Lysobacter sp. KIS68-7]UHQ20621.1 thiol:disulfide interchange protein DsbA/DsbL [Lysobacter sp. KIS68-7]